MTTALRSATLRSARIPSFKSQLCLATFAVLCATQASAAEKPKPKPDLADISAGTYAGDVISDARGSSQSDVTITVTKTGPNQISISSDYARLPKFTAKLTRAMNTIQNASGKEVFLLDLSKSPVGLDVTVDDASWSGHKE